MRYIIILLLVVLTLNTAFGRVPYNQVVYDSTVRDSALKILVEKCNVCHRRQNPRKVFTENNMDELAPAVYKQVFVKKRMPRGNTIKLTEAEQQALLDWLKTRSDLNDE
jgi:uncharacterized membrane protein